MVNPKTLRFMAERMKAAVRSFPVDRTLFWLLPIKLWTLSLRRRQPLFPEGIYTRLEESCPLRKPRRNA